MRVNLFIGVILIGMSDTPRVLILAYYFPPDSSSGALRPLHFANHLQGMGIQVTVLTACEDDFLPDQPRDPTLLTRVHKDVVIVRARVRRPREFLFSLRDRWKGKKKQVSRAKRVGGCPKWGSKNKSFLQITKDLVTDILTSPDPHVGWIADAVKRAKKIVHDENINIIIATGSPWSSMIGGVLLSKKVGVSLILDFRDPWVANPGFVQRGKVARFVERWMERYVVSKTDSIIANTEELREDFLNRYSFLQPDKVYTLPNGFEDYIVSKFQSSTRFTLVHAGALYFSRTPIPLLEALQQLLLEERIPDDRIRIVLVGDLDLSCGKLEDLLNSKELQKTVKIIARLPYDEAMKYQQQADALLLVQPGFPLQVPRKLYEYMAMRRPVLALTEETAATARIVRECRLGKVVRNNSESIKPVLLEMYNAWKDNPENTMPTALVAEYQNSVLIKTLLEILLKTINKA